MLMPFLVFFCVLCILVLLPFGRGIRKEEATEKKALNLLGFRGRDYLPGAVPQTCLLQPDFGKPTERQAFFVPQLPIRTDVWIIIMQR